MPIKEQEFLVNSVPCTSVDDYESRYEAEIAIFTFTKIILLLNIVCGLCVQKQEVWA